MASPAPETPPEMDPRPVVALPRPGLPGAVIAVMMAVAALLLFLILNAHRLHGSATRSTTASGSSDGFPAPPPLSLPPEQPVEPVAEVPPAPPMPPITVQPQVAVPIQPGPPPLPTGLPAPSTQPPAPSAAPTHHASGAAALVYDGGAKAGGAGAQASKDGAAATGGDDSAIPTTVIGNHTTIMPAGTVIPAVLETPIDSTRPGMARAIVSEDARGFDGRRVLIPRGSRLIGDYASDIRSGQKRVLVTWTRLIRPDGVAIRIGSPAADALGGSGIPGRVDTFFFQRFASAVLQSALQVGVNLASRPGNGSVIVGVPGSATGTVGQELLPGSDLKPRIRVKEGAVLTIFVAHDLDFSGTPLVGRDRGP